MGHLPRPPPQPQVAIRLPPRGSHAPAEPDVTPRQRQEGPQAVGAALKGQSPPGPGWAITPRRLAPLGTEATRTTTGRGGSTKDPRNLGATKHD